ncbi:AAA family ATPase [Actinoalloteichus sp. GBA129-24]|uniref:AAA family ATPase n=1 Tax=Actinoalloteichus sp. GBA129-24 TaxID=1612551 RepID=UPI000950AC19|nr:AAA family ATPase [Actinoalloteichus sp. GBA129-24]APU22580.1 ATPase family protein associated with various cellular activities (AAA) [Actinoalloteichus sp. GBA129-24]
MNDSAAQRQAKIDALKAVLGVDSHDDDARLQLIEVLIDDGRTEEAMRGLVEILARDPSSAAATDLMRRLVSPTPAAPEPTASTQAGPASGAAPPPSTEAASPGPGDAERVPVTAAPSDPTDAETLVDVRSEAVRLADVAGMESVKERLEAAFLAPMRNLEVARAYGHSLRGGLLLYGPPGCGKTFIARAVAGELGAKFLSVSLADALDMWMGASEKNVRAIFNTARASAPCVLFIDEIDAIGGKRAAMAHSPMKNVVSQLLTEMDSVDSDNKGVFVLGATNHPWDIDSALRRPGRLDRMLFVTPPDESARLAIIRLNMRGRPVGSLDYASLVHRTEDFSGADLTYLCQAAAERAMLDSIRTNRIRDIETSDFTTALKDVKPSTKSWFHAARQVAQFANHDNSYDELISYLRRRRVV